MRGQGVMFPDDSRGRHSALGRRYPPVLAKNDPCEADVFSSPAGTPAILRQQGPGGKRGHVAVGDEGNNAELRADSKATAIASARKPVEENGRYPRPTKGDGGWSARSLNSHTGTPPGAAKRSLR